MTGAPRAAEAMASATPEIGARLVDPHAAGDVDEDVRLPQREAGMAPEDGHDHGQPLGVDARSDAARHGEVGGRDERLDLQEQRARALDRADDRRAGLLVVGAAEQLRRILHGDQALGGHLEDAELVGRAEAVLDRAQDAVRTVAIALEVQDAVDEVLENARAGDGALLGDVTDEEGRDALLLAHAQEAAGRLADLAHRARGRAEIRRVERLHGVDDADLGPLALERRAHLVEVRLGEDVHVARAAEAVGAQLHLGRRLLAGDEHDLPVARERLQGHEQEGRLADARIAGHEHERGRDEPAAEHAVELGHAGRDPLGVGGVDLHEAQERLTLGGRSANSGRRSESTFLDQRPPAVARRTTTEPLARRVPALRARVLNGRLRHGRTSLGRRSDAEGARIRAERRARAEIHDASRTRATATENLSRKSFLEGGRALERFNALSRGSQVMLIAGVLLLIDTFFAWQKVEILDMRTRRPRTRGTASGASSSGS